MRDERPDNFTVTAKSRNIHVVQWSAPNPAKWEGWVLLRGDAHHDNPHSDHNLERKHPADGAPRQEA